MFVELTKEGVLQIRIPTVYEYPLRDGDMNGPVSIECPLDGSRVTAENREFAQLAFIEKTRKIVSEALGLPLEDVAVVEEEEEASGD